jgi:uncharacterized protein YjbJ (UPF0337 family)
LAGHLLYGGRLNFTERGISMSKDILQGKWNQVKGDVRSWWGKLTDDDVTQIQGNTEKMLGKLQERYGYARQQAEKDLNDFLNAPEGKRRRTA